MSLPQLTTTVGLSYPVPAPENEARSGNSPLSAPQMTEAVDPLESDVATVVVVAAAIVVVVFVLLRAFFTLVESEDELQADTSTRPRRARQGNIRFCIPPLCMYYTN